MAKILVDGDINENLEEPEGTPRSEAIAEKITVDGLVDMGLHLLPWRKPWLNDRCTWKIQRDVLEIRYRTDYILGTDYIFFQDVAVWDTQQ